METLTRLVHEHNVAKVCSCSVCNIYRMCEKMEEITIRTNEFIASSTAHLAHTRPETRMI